MKDFIPMNPLSPNTAETNQTTAAIEKDLFTEPTIGHYYLIKHLTLITGLTDRTIRNYLAMGILQGEKINGLWHFTPEQVENFIRHPSVRPSIQAKHHGLVYDFLLETKKSVPETCVILDLPGTDKKSIAEFFCYRINNGGYHHIQFSFDGIGTLPRVILKGDPAEVMKLVNAYYQETDQSILQG